MYSLCFSLVIGAERGVKLPNCLHCTELSFLFIRQAFHPLAALDDNAYAFATSLLFWSSLTSSRARIRFERQTSASLVAVLGMSFSATSAGVMLISSINCWIKSKVGCASTSRILYELHQQSAQDHKYRNLANSPLQQSWLIFQSLEDHKAGEGGHAASPYRTKDPVLEASMPLSAPLIPGTEVSTPVVPTVQTAQSLSRSVSAAGRLNLDPSPATTSHLPQSYRNAMMGNQSTASSTGCTLAHSSNSEVNSQKSYLQHSAVISAPMHLPQSSERMHMESIRSDLLFGMVSHEVLQNMPHWIENHRLDNRRSDCNPPVQNVPQWMENLQQDTRRSINSDRL
ncbi:hypothetical protein POM88_046989 [Heracleum sosnowskyi]|uniref:Uncharacterized protein n=1 Tax=Heracleum sosnowskyi TaxID=360622 RepID=A0AAD8HAI8_9APIA|nr:hypothetical protein POM88_046989 [Heracleum sosnowskyi]